MSFKTPKTPRSTGPDYGTLWKQYKGEMDNINRRTEGGIADIRARFAAVGAAPELLNAETNRLREAGNLDIAALKQSATYAALEEGFGIASGKVGNPYSTQLAGWEQFAWKERERAPTEAEKAQFVSTEHSTGVPRYTERYRDKPPPATMEEYFNQFYPAATTSVETPEEKVRHAATGYADGSSGGVAPNPLLPSFAKATDPWS